jgi:hypothetical protein
VCWQQALFDNGDQSVQGLCFVQEALHTAAQAAVKDGRLGYAGNVLHAAALCYRHVV